MEPTRPHPTDPAKIAAGLSEPMRRCLRDYARHGYGDGSAWSTTYRALYARGLLDVETGPGWMDLPRGRRAWGVVIRRRWITDLGRAVVAALDDET